MYKVFKTSDTKLSKYSGLRYKILRELGDKERDIEVGSMYKVKLENGKIIDCFKDELICQKQ